MLDFGDDEDTASRKRVEKIIKTMEKSKGKTQMQKL